MKKPYFIVTLFVIISLALCGQTVQLNLDKKHITEIKLCTNTSSTEIPEGYFELTDSVYFVLRSKEGDLSKGDFKDLSALQFSQDGEKKKINRLSPNLDDKKNITSVLLVVARSVIDITKPFEFLYEEEYKSDLMAIPERYWPYYTQFMDYYEKGKDFMDKQQYIASFDQLKYIISESEHAVEFTKFSNYYRVYNDFVPDIITGYQKKQMAKLENLQSKYGSNDRIVLDELEQVRLAKDSVILVNQIFEPFTGLLNKPLKSCG
ncbi:MAG: hypothetical protein R2750_10055 [Bacteroidales bacterium]